MSSQCIQKEVVYTKKVGERLINQLVPKENQIIFFNIFKTLRIESSKYQKEKKSTEILEVVVSETRLV